MAYPIQIDKSSPKPIFRQLEEQILESIQNGDLKPGDRIPSQSELAQTCQVSRATVQKAIDRLIIDEMLYFQQGKGIYVAAPSKRQRLPILQSIDQSLRSYGYDVYADLLLREELEAPRHVAEKLALPSKATVCHIERLQCINDEPMVLQESYLESDRFPEVMRLDLRRKALTEMIDDHPSTQLSSAAVRVGAKSADWQEARILNIEPGAALLTFEVVDYDLDNRPTLYNRNKLRSDRFEVIAADLSEHKIGLEFRSQPGAVSIDLT